MELHAFDELAVQWDESDEMRPTSVFPPVTPPGMAYVPYQQWGKVYDAEEGIDRGTLFPDLDFPFQCAGGDSKR